MKDGSDAISDWAILNALINAVSRTTWVSFHHGGGVGMGYSNNTRDKSSWRMGPPKRLGGWNAS